MCLVCVATDCTRQLILFLFCIYLDNNNSKTFYQCVCVSVCVERIIIYVSSHLSH